MKTNLEFALAIIGGLSIAAPASALGPAPAAPSQSQGAALDPNEVVCEKIQVIGSRLAVKKFCLTRSQWESARLQDRQFVEKIQAGPCVIQINTSSGRPAC